MSSWLQQASKSLTIPVSGAGVGLPERGTPATADRSQRQTRTSTRFAKRDTVFRAVPYFYGPTFKSSFHDTAPVGWYKDPQSLQMQTADVGCSVVIFRRLVGIDTLPLGVPNEAVHVSVAKSDRYGFHVTRESAGGPNVHWYFDRKGQFNNTSNVDTVFLPEDWVLDMAREFYAWYVGQRIYNPARSDDSARTSREG